MSVVRKAGEFPVDDTKAVKAFLLEWAKNAEYAVLLDTRSSTGVGVHDWDALLGIDAQQIVNAQQGHAFEALNTAYQAAPDWWFGYFTYDLKNEIESLESVHVDGIGLPDLCFFQPKIVIGLKQNLAFIFCLEEEPEVVFSRLMRTVVSPDLPNKPIHLTPRIPKADYLDTVEKIRGCIVEGDLYEMNFCQEFYAEGITLDPKTVYKRLATKTNPPFSAFMQIRETNLLCASPERFLQKKGRQLISQPIKGTRKRGETRVIDTELRNQLSLDIKDRAEHVMIVDLVRNDLARSCAAGTVVAKELFGIHTFDSVHQMISTITGTMRTEIGFLDAVKHAFPPGSMTGAPKVMAMTYIEAFEKTKRGLYSGAIGYIDPAENFDFNVVIRSIIYNNTNKYVSVQVGGAIVFDSDPEQEYAECIVKAKAMMEALSDGNT